MNSVSWGLLIQSHRTQALDCPFDDKQWNHSIKIDPEILELDLATLVN